MHAFAAAYDGVYRAGLNAFGAADAVFLNNADAMKGFKLNLNLLLKRLRILLACMSQCMQHRQAARVASAYVGFA
ncbi:unnamed protein product [marine sediment metagenome]|uniref:Uncharacterized protein n=1 Tax=marine sediment metagenome TaxID=412755 RepID=X0ZIH6_9ZZZZ